MTLVHGRVRGHVGDQPTESEPPFEQAFWIVATWRHQQVMRWQSVRTEAEALEAAGLSA